MNNIPSNELIGWKMWEHGVPDSRLTIIGIDEPRICKNGRKRTKLKCLCNCGNITSVDRSNLLRGGVKSCGCYKKDYIKATKSTHGEAHSRLYNVWSSMKNRCYNRNEPEYKNYGGRGIVMCDEWLNDYLSFKKWAEETGYDKDAPKGQCTIDRIDVNGNYEPSNCRWITMEEQLKNTSKTLKIEYNGKIYSLSDLAKELDVKYTTLHHRLKYSNLSVDEIFHHGTLRNMSKL